MTLLLLSQQPTAAGRHELRGTAGGACCLDCRHAEMAGGVPCTCTAMNLVLCVAAVSIQQLLAFCTHSRHARHTLCMRKLLHLSAVALRDCHCCSILMLLSQWPPDLYPDCDVTLTVCSVSGEHRH